MNRSPFLLSGAFAVLLLSSCAKKSDLDALHADHNKLIQKVDALSTRLATLESAQTTQKQDQANADEEIQRQLASISSLLSTMQREQAAQRQEIATFESRLSQSTNSPQAGQSQLTLEQMKSLGRQAATGDTTAIDKIEAIRVQIYKGIDLSKNEDRVRTNLILMTGAFKEIGNAVSGEDTSDPAFRVLLYALGKNDLRPFASKALGLAAATGHQPSLDILLHPEEHGILKSSAVFDLQPAAEMCNKAAVAYLVSIINDDSAKPLWLGASEGLTTAANQGDKEARLALKKFSDSQNADQHHRNKD